MTIIRTVEELRTALAPHRAGSIGFVPTMGALHEGHLSLVRAARESNDVVVLSIFVNPTQFNDPADLKAYVRDEASDMDAARSAGADIVFAPEVHEMYPSGFATVVSVGGAITESFEASSRGRGHFDGMATIVTKLLLTVLPTRAYFGAKDAQQAVVVRRLIADLNLPVDLVVGPTVRDADGLALSSRNTRLTAEERARALAIPRALFDVLAAWKRGERDVTNLKTLAMARLALSQVVPDYLAFVAPSTLEEVAVAHDGTLVLIAARVGSTRLLDNVPLSEDTQHQVSKD